MRSFTLKKLVRDGVYENMRDGGQKVTARALNDDEFEKALLDKIVEEASELRDSASDDTEISDLLEAVEALGRLRGRDFTEYRRQQLARRAERGGFGGRILVERLDLDDDDPWVEYYAAQPDRFQEITD